MMRILLAVCLLIFISNIESDELEIASKINAVLPEGMTVQSIKES